MEKRTEFGNFRLSEGLKKKIERAADDDCRVFFSQVNYLLDLGLQYRKLQQDIIKKHLISTVSKSENL